MPTVGGKPVQQMKTEVAHQEKKEMYTMKMREVGKIELLQMERV